MRIVTAVLAVALSFYLTAGSDAHEYKVGSLAIGHPWSRATPKGAAVAGGYLTVTNSGSAADRLVSATADFAGRLEIHEMSMDNGVMRMRPLRNGLEIKPGQTLELKPSGYHLMFLDLKEGLVQGQRVKGRLVFEKAGPVDVEFAVEAIGGSPAGEKKDPSDHGAAHRH